MAYPITSAVVEQRRQAATVHGAKSEHQIRSVARAHKRRLMRQMSMRLGDLDGIALGYLDGWARAWAKVTLLDEHFAEHGLVAPGGTDATLRVYFTAPQHVPALAPVVCVCAGDSISRRELWELGAPRWWWPALTGRGRSTSAATEPQTTVGHRDVVAPR